MGYCALYDEGHRQTCREEIRSEVRGRPTTHRRVPPDRTRQEAATPLRGERLVDHGLRDRGRPPRTTNLRLQEDKNHDPPLRRERATRQRPEGRAARALLRESGGRIVPHDGGLPARDAALRGQLV